MPTTMCNGRSSHRATCDASASPAPWLWPPSSHSSQPSGSDAASRPRRRCSRAGQTDDANPRASASSGTGKAVARSAASAMPALSIWCGPGNAGGGRSSTPRASANRMPDAVCSAHQSRPRASNWAEAASAVACSTAVTSSGCTPVATRMPGLMMPAFSAAMPTSVSPSQSAMIERDRGDRPGSGRRDHVGRVAAVRPARPPARTDRPARVRTARRRRR